MLHGYAFYRGNCLIMPFSPVVVKDRWLIAGGLPFPVRSMDFLVPTAVGAKAIHLPEVSSKT